MNDWLGYVISVIIGTIAALMIFSGFYQELSLNITSGRMFETKEKIYKCKLIKEEE